MLKPQTNRCRALLDLDGLWRFSFDPDGRGGAEGWPNGLPAHRPIAVPGSWNEQFETGRDYTGLAWYETEFELPSSWQGGRIGLRFGSVNYLAEVWLNGQFAGAHEGGHLPFNLDVTDGIRPGRNRLTVRVDGGLAPDRVPPGNVPDDPRDAFNHPYPDGNFDFFPYCGIHRPVMLTCLPPVHLADLSVETSLEGETGLVNLRAWVEGDADGLRASIGGESVALRRGETAWEGQIALRQVQVWGPGHPYLYNLELEVLSGGAVCDAYRLPVGVRTIRAAGGQLLLNGEPVVLRGFGRHEDFPLNGRGQNRAVAVRDLAMLAWTGANSFRTAHYPCDEDTLTLADQLGILVIAETPAVGLFFAEDGLERRRALCEQMTRELVTRDRNHPSVVMWSVANEPHVRRPGASEEMRRLLTLARELDPTRPVTYVSYSGTDMSAYDAADVVSVNRYGGWYGEYGQIAEALPGLRAEMEALFAQFGKPVLLTEFGADALPGHHAQPPEMFSEEYQADLIEGYLKTLADLPFLVATHVWVLCDFKTGQAVHRANSYNYKGVFTRERRPKLAAHRLKKLWGLL